MGELSRRLGVPIDTEVVIGRLGPPLEQELAHWLPPEEIPAAADLYRSLAATMSVPMTTLMPGAAEAVAAVRRRGGRVVVVTAKSGPTARQIVEFLGLDVDEVVGSAFGAAKGLAIVDFGAAIYVGDHIGDIAAARAGRAVSVAVATGPYTEDALRDHGADVILPDLTRFPGWYRAWGVPEIGAVSTVV